MIPVNFDVLIGKVLKTITKLNNDELVIIECDEASYAMLHTQDCYEQVYCEDINGEVTKAAVIRVAEETTNSLEEFDDEHTTYTFYKIITDRDCIVIRWCGRSNGYYSEEAEFYLLETEDEKNSLSCSGTA